MGAEASDLNATIADILGRALASPCYAELASDSLETMIDFRDSFLARAIQIAIEALPKLILDSPLATGTFFHEGSSAARSVLEIHPTDTGFMHLAELLGYYPTLIPDRGTPWEKDARESFPHWHWLKGPWSSFHQNTGIAVHVTPAAIILQGPATDIVWSNNKGYAGKVDEIASALLCFKHEITPGNVILVCRFEESDELWQEKRKIYAACAKEYHLQFSSSSKHARFTLPRPAFLQEDAPSGIQPRWEDAEVSCQPSELLEGLFLEGTSREIWGQDSLSERLLPKRLTNTKKRSKKSSSTSTVPSNSGESGLVTV
jgi:hypothetical protein